MVGGVRKVVKNYYETTSIIFRVRSKVRSPEVNKCPFFLILLNLDFSDALACELKELEQHGKKLTISHFLLYS